MQKVKLKDLCIGKGEYGIAAAAEPFSKEKIRYLRITDISNFGELLFADCKSISCKGCEQYLLRENDIVFARTGNSTGRSFFYEKKYGPLVYAGFLIKFHIDKNKVNPKYLKYFTISNTYKKWVSSFQGGSTRGNLSEGDYSNMPVYLPSREIQDSLVSIMDSLAEKISINNAIISELESVAKDIYDYWFVQFDFPDASGQPYRSSGGKMVWNEELKREIPEGWKVAKLSDYLNNLNETISSPVGYENLFYTPIDCLPMKRMSFYGGLPASEASTSLQLYHKNSILIGAMRVYFHRVCLASHDGITRSTTMVLAPKKGEKELGYWYEVLNDDLTVEYATRRSVGTQQPYINWTNGLEQFEFPTPSSPELRELYSKRIELIIRKAQTAAQENWELKSLRDWLLPMLMNGQVKVG